MKVCYFLPWYSPATIGGTEIYILQLSHAIKERNDEAIIICPSLTNQTETFEVEGIQVIASPYIVSTPPSFEIAMGIKPPVTLTDFSKLIEKINPDILHFHCFLPQHIFYLETAASKGIKTIITPHLASFSCLRGNLLIDNKIPCDGAVLIDRCSSCLLHKKTNGQEISRTAAFLISKTLFATGINSGHTNKLSRLFSTPFVVKHFQGILEKINVLTDTFIVLSPWYKNVLLLNGFKEEKIKLVQPMPALQVQNSSIDNGPDGILKLTFVGRLIPEKGLNILLQALPYIPSDKIEIHLFGKDTGMFANEIAGLQSKNYRIHKYGEVEHSKVMNELGNMDVLCLPSPWMEMAPLVIQEAFAAGIPVIGSNLGGIADAILDGWNGYLFEHNNAKDLADKINKLINDPLLLQQMKQQCIKNVDRTDSAMLQTNLYKALTQTYAV